MIEFQQWPKIARLNRDIVITEKIDGTNAAVGIQPVDANGSDYYGVPWKIVGDHVVYAQSRKNLITPDKDNFGFAKWVYDNATDLVKTLGPGVHFGEWWGSGIQRGYGLPKGEKRFSLFNTSRWNDQTLGDTSHPNIPGLGVVPTLYEGPFSADGFGNPWYQALYELRRIGSHAAPGFMRPEGIVVYHTAANEMFKVTLEGDEEPKTMANRIKVAA